MLDWLFGNKNSRGKRADAPPPAARASDVPAAPPVDWASRLSEARGDDAELLALAGSQAPIDVRQAAVEAIASEAMLKQAERSFRDRDRRIARAAKQRHTALAAQRETRSQATLLIESARTLAGHALIPLNRLAELDRAWQALDAAWLEPAQRDDFAAAMQSLSSLSRERGDAQLAAERRATQTREAVAALQRITAGAAAGTHDRAQLSAACDAARDVLAAHGETSAATEPSAALEQALQAAAGVDERIAFLDALPELGDDRAEAEPQWQALAPLDAAHLRDPLEARFSAWRRTRLAARQAARALRAEEAGSRQRAARQEEAGALDAALERAEHALAEGQLDAAERHLGEVATLAAGAGIGETQRARAGAAQADYARLKGWQHWGGGVAREELVAEAEALAARGSDAAAPAGPPLSVKALGESIARLRARWKEIDRLGGAGGGALWRRFDEALTAAYQPVAAHAAAQRAMREANLAARQQLLDALEAVALPDAPTGATDWRAVAQALDRWLADWRKLGPVEHTVPREQREPLLARTSAALARLESPLAEARRAAQAEREQLVASARSLAAEAESGSAGPELTRRVRALQARWQEHAKAMPLGRAAEGAAWADFRTAIEAVFSARAAAFSAHDAALQAHAAERGELIDRLAALSADLSPGALRRELAGAESAWQRAGPPPRDAAAALEARYRAARDAIARRIGEAEQARQRAEAEALHRKLELCEALESGDPGFDRATLAERWHALPALRGAWEQALAQRAGLAAGKPAPAHAISTEELLLQIEEGLGLASPPALQEARRTLKLHAMKAALEGRGTVAAARLPPDALMGLLLARSGLAADQRHRLTHVLDAIQLKEDST